jgi:hypothetical protein
MLQSEQYVHNWWEVQWRYTHNLLAWVQGFHSHLVATGACCRHVREVQCYEQTSAAPVTASCKGR